jgi:hypothetical protein
MNQHEMQARQLKAEKLAALFFEIHATDEDVVGATEKDWKDAANLAGCKPPNSKDTVALVRTLLARLYRDEEANQDLKDEAEWEDRQMEESGADRCPPRE